MNHAAMVTFEEGHRMRRAGRTMTSMSKIVLTILLVLASEIGWAQGEIARAIKRATSEIGWTEGATKPVFVKELDCNDGPFRVELPKTVAALRELGPFSKEEQLETLEAGGTIKMEIREMWFDGLKVTTMGIAGDPGYDTIMWISSPTWSMAPNFKVGDPIDDVLSRLGLEQKATADYLYFVGIAADVSFKLRDGRITGIKISCFYR